MQQNDQDPKICSLLRNGNAFVRLCCKDIHRDQRADRPDDYWGKSGIFMLLPAIGYWSGIRIFSLSSQETIPAVTPQPIIVTPVVIQPSAPAIPSTSGETEEAGVKPIPKPKSLWELNP